MTFYWWSHWFWITLLSNILISISLINSHPLSEAADNLSSTEYHNKYSKKVTNFVQTSHNHPLHFGTLANKSEINIKTPLNENENTTDSNTENIFSEQKNILNSKTSSSSPIKYFGSQSASVGDSPRLLQSFTLVNNRSSNSSSIENQNDFSGHRKMNISKIDQDEKTKSVIKEIVPSSNHSNALESAEKKLHSMLDDNHKDNNRNRKNNFSSLSTNTTFNNTTPFNNLVKSSLLPSTDDNATNESVTLASLPLSPSVPHILVGPLHENSTLSSEIPKYDFDQNKKLPIEDSRTSDGKAPFTLENVNKEDELIRAENEHRSRKSKVLSAEYKHINRFINFSSDSKNLLVRSTLSEATQFDDHDEGNISSEALLIQRTYILDAGTISGICFGIFGICCSVAMVGIVLYRRRFLNKPQTLSEPDSSVYIDDSTLRDNSDEMYSLDNDSFLNSLEAMTIQNYWTDTVKHTKL